jgi:hypothetical protein
MNSNRWVVLSCLSLVCAPALAEETGTRVTVTLTQAQGELPDPEKMVQALNPLGGGERQVMVKRKGTETGAEVSLDLWGPTLPASEIPGALRAAFPVLKPAQIDVATLDASSRPKLEDAPRGTTETTTVQGADGKVRRIIKKRVVETR